jgi:catechol 2,3-dioxygenase-like lactoylglutathione lyase family enzyme
MTIDLGRCFHHGVRVADLDAAMGELGPALGLRWCQPQHGQQRVWLPDGGEVSLPLRFTYSADGPHHVELVEGPAGSIWDGRQRPGLHHVGVWSDDVAADTEALLAAGWRLRLAQRSPAAGYGALTYVEPPSGLLVELVSSALEPMFTRWFAGGPLR